METLAALPSVPGRGHPEDSLGLGTRQAGAGAAGGSDPLRVAVVRLPRISNFTDVAPLVAVRAYAGRRNSPRAR